MPVFPADATDLTWLLVVSDLAPSVAWYRGVLGAEVVGKSGAADDRRRPMTNSAR